MDEHHTDAHRRTRTFKPLTRIHYQRLTQQHNWSNNRLFAHVHIAWVSLLAAKHARNRTRGRSPWMGCGKPGSNQAWHDNVICLSAPRLAKTYVLQLGFPCCHLIRLVVCSPVHVSLVSRTSSVSLNTDLMHACMTGLQYFTVRYSSTLFVRSPLFQCMCVWSREGKSRCVFMVSTLIHFIPFCVIHRFICVWCVASFDFFSSLTHPSLTHPSLTHPSLTQPMQKSPKVSWSLI